MKAVRTRPRHARDRPLLSAGARLHDRRVPLRDDRAAALRRAASRTSPTRSSRTPPWRASAASTTACRRPGPPPDAASTASPTSPPPRRGRSRRCSSRRARSRRTRRARTPTARRARSASTSTTPRSTRSSSRRRATRSTTRSTTTRRPRRARRPRRRRTTRCCCSRASRRTRAGCAPSPLAPGADPAARIRAWQVDAGADGRRLVRSSTSPARPLTAAVAAPGERYELDRMTPYDPTGAGRTLDAPQVRIDGRAVAADGTLAGLRPERRQDRARAAARRARPRRGRGRHAARSLTRCADESGACLINLDCSRSLAWSH